MDLKFEQLHTLTDEPTTSSQYTRHQTNGIKRPRSAYEEQNYGSAPSIDRNEWYYPARPSSASDEEELRPGVILGNWGNKSVKGARWVRRGKAAAWGPSREEWEIEQRARQRLKRLLPHARSPSPPTLPHLRPLSPPATSPYPQPLTQHLSYAAFVLDPSMAHSFRSHVLTDLERVTASLIEGEVDLRKTLGRLFQVLSEDPDLQVTDDTAQHVTKREELDDDNMGDNEMDEAERRVARAPNLTSPLHKLFLTPVSGSGVSHQPSLEMQKDHLDKAIAALRELHEDEREYVERLEEIQEGLGQMKAQRDFVWNRIRENALRELKDVAKAGL